MSGTIWRKKVDYNHREKELLSCILPSCYSYHLHKPYKKQKKSLLNAILVITSRKIFLLHAQATKMCCVLGHRRVLCCLHCKGQAGNSARTVPSLYWRCLRVRMVPTITIVIEFFFHDGSDEVITSQFLYFGHGVLGLESFANLLITAKACNGRNWNRMGSSGFFWPQLSSFIKIFSSKQCGSSFSL